jgi:uncharacterized membrane protein
LSQLGAQLKVLFAVCAEILLFVGEGKAATIQGIGILPGGTLSEAFAVSADGSTVVGRSSVGGFRGVKWTQSDGLVDLNDNGGSVFNNTAYAVSADGSVIVGFGIASMRGFGYRWTAAAGSVGLGDATVQSYAASSDGSIVAGRGVDGNGMNKAFRWTQATGAVLIDGMQEVPGMSADGTVMAGHNGASSIIKWTQAAGPANLGHGSANAVSQGGGAIVGVALVNGLNRAFRWTEATGVLPISPDNGMYGEAYAVSADGSIIVGRSGFGGSPVENARIWNAQIGWQNIKDWLFSDYGLDIGAWKLNAATGISASGTTIVGYGLNPQGASEGWVITVPEPSTTFMTLGIACLAVLCQPLYGNSGGVLKLGFLAACDSEFHG